MVLEDITAAWLTDVLRSSGAATGAATAIEVTPIGDGVGLVAGLARLRPTWSGGQRSGERDRQIPVTGREQPDGRRRTRHVPEGGRLLPGAGSQAALPHAECYYAHHDADSDDFMLLFSDLRGDRPVDQINGGSSPEVEMAVDHLADFHAGYWQAPELTASTWLKRLADPPFPQSLALGFEQAWPAVPGQCLG